MALLFIVAAGRSASAQVPRLLHYQATLVESGFPVDEAVDVEVAFYADSTGGAPLGDWSETYSDVQLRNGRLDLLLGSQTPLPDSLLAAPNLYLQITVNGEALPRMQVASAPFAVRAGVAEGVAPGGVAAAALAEGAVTEAALADEAVNTDALASGGVTSRVLADEAVTAEKIASQTVGTGQLASGAVTSDKLGSRAVAGANLADGSVSTSKLTNGAVTSAKVGTGQLVTALNGLTDQITLEGGDNVTVTSNEEDGTITIEAEDNGWGISSRRWKTDIRPLDGALSLVQDLRGVRYRWKENGAADVGLIAEEVGKVVPEVVRYASNGVDAKSVNYAHLVAVLIEAIKEQQAQIKAERARLRDLEKRIEALERARSTP